MEITLADIIPHLSEKGRLEVNLAIKGVVITRLEGAVAALQRSLDAVAAEIGAEVADPEAA